MTEVVELKEEEDDGVTSLDTVTLKKLFPSISVNIRDIKKRFSR
jgi:hypothetical protein